MKLKFVKMSGAGNDFILLDNLDSSLDTVITAELIRKLCKRGLSVGADGVLELRSNPDYPFRMKYYNSDGGQAEMCGNGGRCIAGFAASMGIVSENSVFRFLSDSGVHSAIVTGEDEVRLWMTDPEIHYLDRSLELESVNLNLSFINTGVPHAVVMLNGLESVSFSDIAPIIRKHEIFGQQGTNVDFVNITGESELEVRTWERGVEGETLACGTGAVASAICAAKTHGMELPVSIKVRSGRTLTVGRDDDGWWLQGEARIIYSAVLDIPLNNNLTAVV